MDGDLPTGYRIRLGTNRDRILLVKFMVSTYQELFPHQSSFSHLRETVTKYFSEDTPLWWVEDSRKQPIACLWMGNAIDQASGKRYSHIFLLMVLVQHRRQGIGKALMNTAEKWAKAKGSPQIGLHVFTHNQPALNLYYLLGFKTRSLSMIKSLEDKTDH